MTLKEIHAKAGSLFNYIGYILLLFGWYLLSDVYITVQSELPGVSWGLRLLVFPIILSVVMGGIHERQNMQDVFEKNSFFSPLKSHLLRFIGANILITVLNLIITMVVVLVAGYEPQNLLEDHKVVFGILSGFFSILNIFWFSAIVVERKIFRGLIRSIKTFLFNPMALAIGILWGAICFADAIVFDFESAQISLVLNIARSGVFAVVRVLATMYILAIYKIFWASSSVNVEGEKTLSEPSPARSGEKILSEPSTARPGEKLARASFGFTFVSFLPLLHLVALILGVMAIIRSRRFVLRAAIACWVGGFFTIVYSLLIAGFIVGRQDYLPMPGYAFLADGNSELETYVELLDKKAYKEVQAQLGSASSNNPERNWAFDCALALAKYEDNDLNGALQDFYTASRKNPERSEFYFYYGIALLDNEKGDMAVEQFRLALEHEPKLTIADRYIALIQNAYQPSRIASVIMVIIILSILFTLHEYGHAYAAWKLGDDTAKNQGRLTLNPIPHLDVFGSILLPAILLLQQSDVIFGWAKPVQVNSGNFKNPKKNYMLVSFAGPAVNLMVSMVCLVILGLVMLLVHVLWPETITLNLAAPSSAVSIAGAPFSKGITILIVFLKQLFYTSLVLGFLNLIPIPPLDGAWIFAGFLPERFGIFFEKARPFGFLFFLLLALTPILDYILSIPIVIAYLGLGVLFSVMGFA